MEDELLTVNEIADRLKVHPETVRRWIRTGRLRGVLAGTNQAGFRVWASDLQAFLKPAPRKSPPQKKLAA
jgi:excisionase family DNA binding protein